MKKIIIALLISSMFLPTLFAGGGSEGGKSAKDLKIGLSLPTQQEERWVRDLEYMKKYAAELGITLIAQVSNADQAMQAQQVDNLLTQGIHVLILAPHDASASAQLVENAAKEKVPVISYDRIVTNTDKLDYYLTFDNNIVGAKQGEFLVSKVKKGNIIVMAGAPTDNNARMFYDGAMTKIQPMVDNGSLKIVNGKDFLSRAVDNWVPSNAQRMAEDILTREKKIDGVLAPNDGTAGGIIEALRASGIVGIPITGQDGEIAAVKRIIKGEQSMTIFKDTRLLAKAAIDAAIKIAKGEKVETQAKVNNGVKDVASILLPVEVITKENYKAKMVDTGYIKEADLK